MSENAKITDLNGTGKRVTTRGIVKERLPIRDEIPLRKFFVQEENEPGCWVAAVVFDEAEIPKLEIGSTYIFENVIDDVYENDMSSYAPQLQLKTDECSDIRRATDNCATEHSDDSDDDGDDSNETTNKTNRPTLSGPGKSIRTDGSAGERVSGRNPLNDPDRIKNAGLHQGSP